jgi:hypothetical protein
MQPFRQPQPPQREPETDTSELQELVERKRRGTRRILIGIVVGTLLLPPFAFGFLKGLELWELRRWRAGAAERERRDEAEEERARARAAENAKHMIPLAPDDRDRAERAITGAEKRIEAHAGALARGWADLVTHRVLPDGKGKACPIEVPAPDLATLGALGLGTNVDESSNTSVAWVFFDGRNEPMARMLAAKTASASGRNPDLDEVRGLVALSPPPVPRRISAFGVEVKQLRPELDRPMLDSTHADFVKRAESLFADVDSGGRRYDYYAIVDVWFLPAEKEPGRVVAGYVVAHSFIWDSVDDRAVCAGVAIAGSSHFIEARTIDMQSLLRDLRLQLEKELASSIRSAKRL